MEPTSMTTDVKKQMKLAAKLAVWLSKTIDFDMENGSQIEIEQRAVSELLPDCYALEDSLVSAWNPVFDVTPASLITAIVTERGVVLEPEKNGVESLQ